MKVSRLLGIGLVLVVAAVEGCGPGSGGTGGGGGMDASAPPGTGGSTAHGATGSTSQSSSGGMSDRCHRTGVVASCDVPPQNGEDHGCTEFFDQAQADAAKTGCADKNGTYTSGPCDRTGSIGFCAEGDLAGVQGASDYFYNAAVESVLVLDCQGPLNGTWCPLP